jgi:hypothetical protein
MFLFGSVCIACVFETVVSSEQIINPCWHFCFQALAAECCLEIRGAKGRLTDDSSPESWFSLTAGGDPGTDVFRDLVSTHVSVQLNTYAVLRCWQCLTFVHSTLPPINCPSCTEFETLCCDW